MFSRLAACVVMAWLVAVACSGSSAQSPASGSPHATTTEHPPLPIGLSGPPGHPECAPLDVAYYRRVYGSRPESYNGGLRRRALSDHPDAYSCSVEHGRQGQIVFMLICPDNCTADFIQACKASTANGAERGQPAQAVPDGFLSPGISGADLLGRNGAWVGVSLTRPPHSKVKGDQIALIFAQHAMQKLGLYIANGLPPACAEPPTI